MAELSVADQDLRGLLARIIARRGHAPSLGELAEEAGSTVGQVEESLRRLHDAHALLLHPHRCQPWAVHPFALSPGSCWVETPERGYWANCLYCALGIAAALKSDARITTRLGGEARTARYRVEGADSSTRTASSISRSRRAIGGTMSSTPAPRSSPSRARRRSSLGASATLCREVM